MKKKGLQFLLFCCSLFLIPSLASGQPMQMSAGCHCFKNRTYDPAQKFAADEYILATSFNSMLATFFSISKKQIIMLRMRMGIGGEDLLTSFYLGKMLGKDFQQILSQRSSEKSWNQIVTSDDLNEKQKNDLPYTGLFFLASPDRERDLPSIGDSPGGECPRPQYGRLQALLKEPAHHCQRKIRSYSI